MIYRLLIMLAAATLLFASTSSAAQAMDATTYGSTDGYAGQTTASGDICCDHNAASPDIPFGTILTVCYDECTDVVVNDRCNCSLDIGYPAAAEIGMLECGKCDVEVY